MNKTHLLNEIEVVVDNFVRHVVIEQEKTTSEYEITTGVLNSLPLVKQLRERIRLLEELISRMDNEIDIQVIEPVKDPTSEIEIDSGSVCDNESVSNMILHSVQAKSDDDESESEEEEVEADEEVEAEEEEVEAEEEEDEIELEEMDIDGVMYYVTSTENGSIYSTDDDTFENVIGTIVEGIVHFSK